MKAPFAQTILQAIISFSLILATTANPSSVSASSREAIVEKLVLPVIEEKKITGLSAGVLTREGEFFAGYGQIASDDPRRPDADTLYEIGSITKVFTGILLADAALRKEVALDQPINELLPEDARLASEHPPIRLWHLATHTSGLPRLPINLLPMNPENPYADYTPERLYEYLRTWKLNRAPEARAEYSNLGSGLLGHLIELKCGQSYEALVKERVLTPLGMTNTGITLDESARARLAPPHRANGTRAANWDIPTLAGAGALRSSTRDLLRFLRAHLEAPEGLLGKAIEEAWKVHWSPAEGEGFQFGLGWHLARDGETRWHNGGTGGYRSMALVNRKAGVAVIVLANTASDAVDRLAEELFRAMARKNSENKPAE